MSHQRQTLMGVCVTPGPKTVNYPPPEGKKPDATFVQKTNAETAHLYR